MLFSIFLLLIGVESKKCTHSAKLDLQLIVDSSSSVGERNFHLMMQNIADDIVGQFDIGKDKTRISVFKYSCPKVMVEEFDLDTYTDAASLKKAIKAVKYEIGCTMTGEAMEKALAHYSAKMRKEKETAKACIVFTDGTASDEAKVPAALKAWEKKGVAVFAVGIGNEIHGADLEEITGDTNRFITVPDFKAIGKAGNPLIDLVCKVIPPAGSCFTFKKEDETAYVRIHPLQDEVLNNFTIDFTYEFSDATSSPYFLSYAYTDYWNNEAIIGQKYGIINDKKIYYPKDKVVPLEIGTTERVTITRMNSEISVYVNGKFVHKKTITDPIRSGGSWILGQEQDKKEGKFSKKQRFIGKICDFQMWNYGMNQESLIKLFLNDGSIKAGNVFDSPPSYALEKKDGATQSPQRCFTFKKEDEKAYVKLTPIQDKVLNDFTMDLTFKISDPISNAYFLSYAYTDRYNNEFLIGRQNGIINSKYFYKKAAYLPLDIETPQRVTVTRINSKISVYANDKLVHSQEMSTPIRAGGSWILGQEQDKKEGKFEKTQRFIGKICDFQMWNYGMNEDSLKKLFLHDSSVAPGNVFNSALSYALKKKNGAM